MKCVLAIKCVLNIICVLAITCVLAIKCVLNITCVLAITQLNIAHLALLLFLILFLFHDDKLTTRNTMIYNHKCHRYIKLMLIQCTTL
jgi:hypothetical protein